jgi:predicted hydrocarbon binding protein
MTDQYYYPNIWGRSILTSAEEILGTNGVKALLNLAGMQAYIGNYPPDNIKKTFPFTHVAKLQLALYDMYGSRGARVFATRGGEQTFKHSLDKYDRVQKAAQAAMSVGSVEVRHRVGLQFFSKFFNAVSDQVVHIEENDAHWYWVIETCPMCWERKADEPVCHLGIGVLNAASFWATGGKRFRIAETKCIAMGDDVCVYTIEKIPVN